jgi:hypothetical protein
VDHVKPPPPPLIVNAGTGTAVPLFIKRMYGRIGIYLHSLSISAIDGDKWSDSRDQNPGRSHSMKTDNSSIERVEEFKHLGSTLTDQNSIHEDIKSRLKFGILAIIRCRIFCLPVCYLKT